MIQSLEDIPVWFADTMDISTISEVVMLFLTESMLVGIGWMPFWVLIATLTVAAMAVATLGTGLVTGD